MILEDIQKAYFRLNLTNKIGVELKISLDSYRKMLKESVEVVKAGRPNDDGSLKPMFGRPVTIDNNLDCAWVWIIPDDKNM